MMSSQAGSETEKSPPLVSAVIPTYGRSERLINAVRSVIKQTYSNIELFIVDDGSPDPISKKLTDVNFEPIESVTFIRHNKNRGANVARNSGIRAATGEYVAFLDSDDRWEQTKITEQVDAFKEADEDVGVIYTGKRTETDNETNVTIPTAEGNIVKDLLTGATFGQFSSVMVRSNVIDAAGLPDERFPAWQDREWFFRLAKHCQFIPVKKPLTYRRVGLPDSITKKFREKRDIAYPLFVDKHYSFAREHGLYYARTFLATLRRDIARSAARAGQYREARKYFWRSFLASPLHRPVYIHLVASIGGKWTYKPAAHLRQKVSRAKEFLGSP